MVLLDLLCSLKKMNKKLLLVAISVLFLIAYLIFDNSHLVGLCDEQNYSCRLEYTYKEWSISFAPYLFILTLGTSILSKNYFEYWFRFAAWAIPLGIFIIVGTYAGWIFKPSGGGVDPMRDAFENFIVILVYIAFTIGSVIQLIRAYRNRKNV
jgi:hypothetical protein